MYITCKLQKKSTLQHFATPTNLLHLTELTLQQFVWHEPLLQLNVHLTVPLQQHNVHLTVLLQQHNVHLTVPLQQLNVHLNVQT